MGFTFGTYVLDEVTVVADVLELGYVAGENPMMSLKLLVERIVTCGT